MFGHLSEDNVFEDHPRTLGVPDAPGHRDTGMPPMHYLRQTRLKRVREALRQANATETTVGSVASGFGFVHSGRFAAAYWQYYGEQPSVTLRRDVG
jgi:transcriptional regulator GlxA family with amidase domain